MAVERKCRSLTFSAAIVFLIACGPQSPVFSNQSGPRIEYRIHVDAADLSNVGVEMRLHGNGSRVLIAMASHPEYDDRYWRYVEDITAESGGAVVQVKREENALWSILAPRGDLIVRYRIHLPPQTSPTRAAWRPFLSSSGGLVGDLHTLMYVVGETSAPASVTLDLPVDWAVASGLDPTHDPRTFATSSVELMLDSPIVIGRLRQWDFKLKGVLYRVVYLPQPNAVPFDDKSLVSGIRGLVSEALKIGGTMAPYRRYTFVYQDGADGALEHLNSVTIGVKSQDLAKGLSGVFQITAHEFFHTWNLMRVRPVERVGVRYRPAEPTAELWWSEGVTIYFSDILLRRAKLPVFDPTRLSRLERSIASYLATPGYSRISAERASRANDNPVALGDDFASIYLQGELLGVVIDLMIRDKTHGKRSLDNVMRDLSARFTPQRGVTDSDIENSVKKVCRCEAHSLFEAYIRGAGPIDFDQYLGTIGMRADVTWSAALGTDGNGAPDLRIFAFSSANDAALRLRLTNPVSAWGKAGLHTGDQLLSIDGQAVSTSTEFRNWLGKLKVGSTARVEIARAGSTLTVTVPISGYDRPTVHIREITNATDQQKRLRSQWLAAL